MTFIKRMKRGKNVYLAECKSVREGKKVRTVIVEYLGREGDQKGVVAEPKQEPYCWKPPERSSRHGDVALLWELAETLKLTQTIDRICLGKSGLEGITPGKLLTIWAINRVIDPQMRHNWINGSKQPHYHPSQDFPVRIFEKMIFMLLLMQLHISIKT
jgi:hypothetical protein